MCLVNDFTAKSNIAAFLRKDWFNTMNNNVAQT